MSRVSALLTNRKIGKSWPLKISTAIGLSGAGEQLATGFGGARVRVGLPGSPQMTKAVLT